MKVNFFALFKPKYNKEGYDNEGFDKQGFDTSGFDNTGYDIDGFDKYGFDIDGFDRSGFNSAGYDIDGFDKSGFDKDRFDRSGFNSAGYDKQGFDRNGFNSAGYDIDGFDKSGFDIGGFNQLSLNKDGFSKKQMKQYNESLTKYLNKNIDSEVDLAICYLNGIGITINYERAFELIIEGAYNNSLNALRLLGDCYYCGDIVSKNINLSLFIYALCDGKYLPAINQYKAMAPIIFSAKDKEKELVFNLENNHLNFVIDCIDDNIKTLKSEITQIDNDTWWMDGDQRKCWVIQNYNNKDKRQAISNFELMKSTPYYARMDSMNSCIVQTHYIGQKAFIDNKQPEASIVSVWSEYGKKYRAKNEIKFTINGYQHEVTLRRRFDILDGNLIEIFDDYSAGSDAANARITDPYLLRILEEKKGEKNITNIIRSIQLNQNDIIEYNFNKSLIVQGCAGSGKTMILLHRLANMKYNIKNLDLTRIKIITPNSQFSLFIDELSRNLNIDNISKLTLGEYYISLLGRYRAENQEKYKKQVTIKAKNGNYIEQLETSYRETGPTEKTERDALSNDADLDFNIVSTIYSDAFATALVKECKIIKESHDEKYDYGLLASNFNSCLDKVLRELGVDQKISRNYNCILYAKVLFNYIYFGVVRKTDSLLCIDEGQDISKLQYALVKKVNGGNITLNIYGDLAQQVPNSCGIESWNRILGMIDSNVFTLNENYRNSDDIIKFYNKNLGINNISFGLKTKEVEKIKVNKLITHVKLQLILKNRTSIICNNPSKIPQAVLNISTNDVLNQNKVSVLTVRQAKGLEFDSVFVYDDKMDKNEKYISYSRALSELYIVEE